MGHHHRRHVAVLAATLCLIVVHEGMCADAARPLRRLHAVEERTEPAASQAVLDVAAAEAPEGVSWGGGGGGGEEALSAGKWLTMPMSLTFPEASALPGALRFPPVSPFPVAGAASMPWLPAFPGPGGIPTFVPPYVGATRQEQLSLWASLFNPMQVRPRLPASTPRGGDTIGGPVVDRGTPAIASGGKAVEGETMDVPGARTVQLGVPKWGVFLGNIDHRN